VLKIPAFGNTLTVSTHPKNLQDRQQTDRKRKDKCQHFSKLKEVQADTQSQNICTTFNFTPTLPSPPTTRTLTEILLKTLASEIE